MQEGTDCVEIEAERSLASSELQRCLTIVNWNFMRHALYANPILL